jgi:hypothetical protein
LSYSISSSALGSLTSIPASPPGGPPSRRTLAPVIAVAAICTLDSRQREQARPAGVTTPFCQRGGGDDDPGSGPSCERRSWWSWKLFLNGYLDELAYDLGAIDRSTPFPSLKASSRVNDRVRAAGDDPRFSARIRAGLPPDERGHCPGSGDPVMREGSEHEAVANPRAGAAAGKITALTEPTDQAGKPRTCVHCTDAEKDRPIVGLVCETQTWLKAN